MAQRHEDTIEGKWAQLDSAAELGLYHSTREAARRLALTVAEEAGHGRHLRGSMACFECRRDAELHERIMALK